MTDRKPPPREQALQHLRLALDSGVRGVNRDAILTAIDELENSKSAILTDMHYRNLKPGQKLVDPERPGLLVRHGKRTGHVWIYRYDHPATHKQIELKFGTYPKLGVAEARETWQALRRKRLAGEEPRLGDASSKTEMTINDLVQRYMTDYARKVKRSWAEDERLLLRHVLPNYGSMPATKFGREDVAAILLNIKEGGAPREAEKVRAVLSTLFNVGRGKTRKIPLLKGSWLPSSTPNPVDGVMLEQRTATNYKPSTRELRNYVRSLSGLGDVGDLLRVQIETTSRIGEAAGMMWQELDLDIGIWSLPAERVKNGRAHKVMLARQTIERLRAGEDNGSGYVFPAPRNRDKPIRTDAVQHQLAASRGDLGVGSGFTSHSTRHAALTWLAEQGCPREVRDRISNHKAAANSGVDHIYVAAELNAPAREWTQRWADYLAGLEAENVVNLRELV